jgi:AraC-like DNA-binding protein
MYSPARDGIEKTVQAVRYTKAKPPDDLSRLVDCFWELRTELTLPEDFRLHALPDACVNILFNQIDTQIAGVTALRTTYEVLNLGKTFHYAGIQLLPGVWRGDPGEIADRFVGTPYQGDLPLLERSQQMAGLEFAAKQPVMAKLVRQLINEKIIVANEVTATILLHLEDIYTVADMARFTGLSARHLQRTLRQITGFSPHDFLKVLRLQLSFKQDYLASYADQSHYIHSFRKITGYTPGRYTQKFDV